MLIFLLQACKSSAVVAESASKSNTQETTNVQDSNTQSEEKTVTEPSVTPASKVLIPLDKTKMQAVPVKKVETKTN